MITAISASRTRHVDGSENRPPRRRAPEPSAVNQTALAVTAPTPKSQRSSRTGRQPRCVRRRRHPALTGIGEVIISCVKAALFELIAGLVARYRGLSISRGATTSVTPR